MRFVLFFEEEKNHIPLNNVVFVIVLVFRVLFFPESTLPKKRKKKELLNLTSLVFEKHCDSCSFVFLFLLLFW